MKNFILLIILTCTISVSFSQGVNADLIDSLVSKKLVSKDRLKYTYSKDYIKEDHDVYYILANFLLRKDNLIEKPLPELHQLFTEMRVMSPEFLEVLNDVHSNREMDNQTKYNMLKFANISSEFNDYNTRQQYIENLETLGFYGKEFDVVANSFLYGNSTLSDLFISSDIFIDIPKGEISISKDLESFLNEFYEKIFKNDYIEVAVKLKKEHIEINSSGYSFSIGLNDLFYDLGEKDRKDIVNLEEMSLYPLLELAQQIAADNRKYAAIKEYDFYSLFLLLPYGYEEFASRYPHLDFIGQQYGIIKLNSYNYIEPHTFPIKHKIKSKDFGLAVQLNISNPRSTDIAYMAGMLKSKEKDDFIAFIKKNIDYLDIESSEVDEIYNRIINARIYDRASMTSYLNVRKLTFGVQIFPTEIPSKGASIKNQFNSIYTFFNGEFEVDKMTLTEDNILKIKIDKKEYNIKNSRVEVLKLGSYIMSLKSKEKRNIYRLIEFGKITTKEYYFIDETFRNELQDLLDIRLMKVDPIRL